MSGFTHIVRFLEVTPHEVRLEAASDSDALGIARRLTETLSPTDRARTFVTSETRYDNFEVQPILRPYRVTVDVRAVYEIGLQALSAEDAEEKAEDQWIANGPDSFSFEDFIDVHFEAEEVER